jgi:Uncharacterized protein conserved in bacteria (DUF2064)
MTIHANALALMAKAPVAGQVKTRLLPAFTAEEAAELSRTLLVDQLKHLQEFAAADFYLAFAPGGARSLMEDLAPPCFRLLPQQGDDLGARMEAVFAWLFAAGHKNIVLIGGDLAPVPLGFFDETYGFSKHWTAGCAGTEPRWRLLFGRLQSTGAGNFPGYELEPQRSFGTNAG